MAQQRIYRFSLSPESALERLRSGGGPDPKSPALRIVGRRFHMGADFLGPTLRGDVLEEEGRAVLDLRLSLGSVHGFLECRDPVLPLPLREEHALGALGFLGIGLGLLWVAWRPRHQRARAYWAFFDRLFADVKTGEEQP